MGLPRVTGKVLWDVDPSDKLVPDQLSIMTPEQFERAKYAALKAQCLDLQVRASRGARFVTR